MLHSICQQIWKTQQLSLDWKRSVFIPISKKNNVKECSNYHRVTFISHASKVMLKILQVKFQQYMNWELPDVQAGCRKGRGTEVKLPTFVGSKRKQGNSRKTSTSASLTMLQPLCGSQQTGYFLKKWEYQNTVPVCWETRAQVMKQVRSRHGKMDFFKIGKGIQQGCILSPCLFHSYAEYIMQMLDWMNYKLE